MLLGSFFYTFLKMYSSESRTEIHLKNTAGLFGNPLETF